MVPAQTVRIMCPGIKCRTIMTVPETSRGKNIKCPQCKLLFKMPAPIKPNV